MSVFIVRPHGTSEKWQIVQADDSIGAARVAAKHIKVGDGPKKRKLPEAWEVARLRTREWLGTCSTDGCPNGVHFVASVGADEYKGSNTHFLAMWEKPSTVRL